MLRSMIIFAKNVSILLTISAALTACGASSDLAPLSGSVPIAQGSITSASSSSVAPQVTSLSSIKTATTTKSSIASSGITATNKSNTTSTTLSSSVSYATSNSSFNTATITNNITDEANPAKAISSAKTLVASSKTNSSSAQVSSVRSSLASSLSSSSIASSKTSSSKSTVSSSSASSSNTALAVSATIQWSHPTARENGSYLNLDEIGGYQIRFKNINANDASFTYITIPGNLLTKYTLPMAVIKNIKFEIAVYDSKGLYSEFVPIN